MLRRSQAQLFEAMALRALREQIDHFATGTADPIDGFLAIAIPEHFDALDQSGLACPFRDRGRGFEFPGRNAGRCDFDSVDIEIDEQHAGELEFLGRRVGDVWRLFAVAKGRVHHSHSRGLDGRPGGSLGAGFGSGSHLVSRSETRSGPIRSRWGLGSGRAGEYPASIGPASRAAPGGGASVRTFGELDGRPKDVESTQIEVDADQAGQRLDRFLADRLGLSRARVRHLLEVAHRSPPRAG